MIIEQDLKITYDDVLLKPVLSDIISREAEVDISVDFLGKKIAPIISSNMDYVTGVKMLVAMQKAGALGILNRFEPLEDHLLDLQNTSTFPRPLIISIGIRDIQESIKWIDALHPDAICIDVAHGDHQRVIDTIKLLRDRMIPIIAGNVATREGFYNLARAGVYAIKVGIGPGSVCTTREVTGVGVPQLSAVIECAEERDSWFPDVQIIADGGINSSGDIVKALAAGANTVMLGKLLAGHDECPGQKIAQANGSYVKVFRGQSMLGSNGKRYAPEGISGFVPTRGPVEDTIRALVGGIRSGFSYLGARNIQELRERAIFQLISNATKHENSTRVLQEI